MELDKITHVTGRGVPVPGDDIDTDRIIPARFMKCVTFDGLGEYAFYDARFHEDGRSKDHPLDAKPYEGATILISGNNFGCGSSREHAPQALYRFGIRAVIAESFAEIFFGNSVTLGMPCISVSHQDRLLLSEMVEANPGLELAIDLVECRINAGDKVFPCEIRDSARSALTSGRWDPLSELMSNADQVHTTARKLTYVGD
jgi:3-isopropylmalate/(R)-2-methylmalate dehydratase small subunit